MFTLGGFRYVPDVFQRLFRQDLLVASLFRNFLLAERIMKSYDCNPVSHPFLPSTHKVRCVKGMVMRQQGSSRLICGFLSTLAPAATSFKQRHRRIVWAPWYLSNGCLWAQTCVMRSSAKHDIVVKCYVCVYGLRCAGLRRLLYLSTYYLCLLPSCCICFNTACGRR